MSINPSPEDLISAVRKGLTRPLPGAVAHERMRANPSGQLRPRFTYKTSPKPGAVLILLYEQDGIIRFPLIKRPDYPGMHGGQISLPGGKVEAGEDVITAALREANEEIGVNPGEPSVMGQLSPFHVVPSNFIVSPIVAVTRSVPTFVPDPVEVERIIIGEISLLLPEESIMKKEIVVGDGYRLMAPYFDIQGETVWGATAMILSEFSEVLRSGLAGE